MRAAPVIPVLVLDDPSEAVAIGAALVKGGLPVLEVTLRTPRALEVLAAMTAIDGAIVGAGTVLDAAQLDQALDAGARFIVSPGLTDRLAKAAAARRACFLPGVANASDIMRGLDLGLNRFKFFPAEASGGLRALKALAGPFGDVRFCPTGGITLETAPAWLAEEAVLCVGGSWLVKPGLSTAEIEAAASRASSLPR
ncbi:bifunctional 4-hydroxy-2-oxoglutarate aldolase/2-dehydro-3-deoxy-phosphogluconate aldolase [Sphingomonas sp. ID1715]|uniref:bifunctional 4-hydroxy-2-oxoglutarate aldolase/2-dehydro-3-deoxy-phosphogluconate aldolase n=1 Tax=Sphingomonas sp. ID1715 TaxID=1656898 RepID=UPI001487A3FF|nr:bifunctional 4-hydroxy-2-oxoglutarate aldolase/2-dehydro-3-deoxy-phosphogluconate aldolase [Sphingomonas sp. ID1715]NNM75826.1 bifunctional 4-hydroxy-2-oxoglutarate aldolase/2-dehydro-3-deoxy-phosphogluconate aldolase [Sphingomonas sp. ID1715]